MEKNKKARIEKEAVQLPEDVTAEILKTLPVKSLLRFSCACKTWYSLISDPDFFNKLHQKRSCVVICGKYERKFSTISVESLLMKGKKRVRSTPLYLSWEPRPKSKLLGSCNGLVCVFQPSPLRPSLILWNPSTRKFMKLPCSARVPANGCSQGSSPGFGYDESTGDYKLVWMACKSKKRMIEFDMFSLKSKTWSSFDHSRPSNIILSSIVRGPQCTGVFSNRAIHWIVCHKDRSSNNGILILGLALKTPKEGDSHDYRLLETPKECDLHSKVVSLSGCLCLYTRAGSSTDLWMMKEYGVKSSWIKLVSLPTTLSTPRSMSLCTDHPIHFLNEEGGIVATYCSSTRGEIMRLKVEEGAIVSYETPSSFSTNDFTFFLEESLASLN